MTDTTTHDLTFQLELFGTELAAQQQKLSFSYKAKSLKHKMTLTPKHTTVAMFPKSPSVTDIGVTSVQPNDKGNDGSGVSRKNVIIE